VAVRKETYISTSYIIFSVITVMFIILIMDSNKNTRITSKALYSVYINI